MALTENRQLNKVIAFLLVMLILFMILTVPVKASPIVIVGVASAILVVGALIVALGLVPGVDTADVKALITDCVNAAKAAGYVSETGKIQIFKVGVTNFVSSEFVEWVKSWLIGRGAFDVQATDYGSVLVNGVATDIAVSYVTSTSYAWSGTWTSSFALGAPLIAGATYSFAGGAYVWTVVAGTTFWQLQWITKSGSSYSYLQNIYNRQSGGQANALYLFYNPDLGLACVGIYSPHTGDVSCNLGGAPSYGFAVPLTVMEGFDGWSTTGDNALWGDLEETIEYTDSAGTLVSEGVLPITVADTVDGTLEMTQSEAQTRTETDVDTVEISTPQNAGYYTVDLTDIFPFCIPFDIYKIFQLLNASPVAPHVEIPINFPIGGSSVSYTFDIDLSVFNGVAQVLRTMELIAFCVGLALATRKMIKW